MSTQERPNPKQPRKIDELAEDIKKALIGGKKTVEEIKKAVRAHEGENIHAALNRLADQGEIERDSEQKLVGKVADMLLLANAIIFQLRKTTRKIKIPKGGPTSEE